MESNFNPYLSVDCVVFGFQVNKLLLLLIEKNVSSELNQKQYKLPGSLLHYRENPETAANRVLVELTGLSNLFLKQFHTFGDPDRIHVQADKEWIEQTYNVEFKRIVSIAYFALINIDDSTTDYKHLTEKAVWVSVNEITHLAFDHSEIYRKALETLQQHLKTEPIGFELLPEKFTIRQLQTVYETILNTQLDNRNFRKKVLKASYLKKLDEYQSGEAFRPAVLYSFDKELYIKMKTENYGFNF